MKIIYLDTETTGPSPAEGRFVQLAYKVADTEETVNELFNPGTPIEFGAMAVHQITEEMVADKPDFQDSPHKQKLIDLLADHILVAHNAPFDVGFLRVEEIYPKYVIDSYKVAYKYLQTDVRGDELVSHALQYLRFALNIDISDATAHDALGDILILEKLFELLIPAVKDAEKIKDKDKTLEMKKIFAKMIEVSNQPRLLRTIGFGKHRGRRFEELAATERDYLEWMQKQTDMDEDVLFTVNHYLNQ